MSLVDDSNFKVEYKHVNVCLEHRFYEYEGNVYTKLAFAYSYWQDYLNFFDSVTIVARVKKCSEFDPLFIRVDGTGVNVFAMPYYKGIKGFVLSIPYLLGSSFNFVRRNDNFILRTGNITNIFWIFIILFNRKYLREYPGNIKEGVIGFVGDSFIVKLLAIFLQGIAKLQSRFSLANSFVSQDCMDIYSSRKPSYVFSSFNISELPPPKSSYSCDEGVRTIVTVGRLEGEKGHHDLILAISDYQKQFNNYKILLNIVGDGSKLSSLKDLATALDVECHFYGAITDRNRLFNIIKSSDLFCLPSHTEGMPRSLLEALGLGMPCIASNVGGIPEVLSEEFCFEPKSPRCISILINKMFNDNELLSIGSANIKNVSQSYSFDKMMIKKKMFWSSLYE